ncbi:hypothetical protein BH10BDE1_BH10BDE1_31210 [soil metagenome]
MDIFTTNFMPPLELKTDQFHLFPTDAALYTSDYEAVMKSRGSLRVWSQSNWPEDTFTVEQNRDDLMLHVADNQKHEAYGFMLYTLDRNQCLGSVYVNPLSTVVSNYSLTVADRELVEANNARIDFWVSDDVNERLEKSITVSIRDWLKNDWKINALFSAREGMARRIQIYEAIGLEKAASLTGREPGISLLLYR